ncbi:hypothetical protein Mapa_015846 [Marchantia paleacea]|nr:hypothetical protein Mapa_015846 [Marchantia paleacea]
MQTTNQVRFDNDLVRWGLHLLDGGGSLFPPSNGNNTASQIFNPAHESSTTSNNYNYSNEGATGRETEDQGYGTAGVYQDGGLSNHFQSLGVEEEGTMGPQTRASCSSPDRHDKARSPDYELYQHGDDDEFNLTLALALSEDEYRFDEEVAKRLTKLDSISHVPRVNTDFPTLDAASLDHQRLIERLVLYGLNERKIQGDGNCQFRALSDQLYRTPEHHKFVRKTIVNQLKAQPDVYSGYVPMNYHDYLKKMAKSGEWGDHVTLQAAADHFGVRICLVTSFKDTAFIEILPAKLLSTRVMYLSFWAEIHYNSIYPEGDNPESVEDDWSYVE